MRTDKIVIGRLYRLKSSPAYGYVRPVRIIRPGTWEMKELAKKEGIAPFKFVVVECEHTVYKDSGAGLIRYFRPADIIEGGCGDGDGGWDE